MRQRLLQYAAVNETKFLALEGFIRNGLEQEQLGIAHEEKRMHFAITQRVLHRLGLHLWTLKHHILKIITEVQVTKEVQNTAVQNINLSTAGLK